MTCVIFGATGGIGRELVKLFREDGVVGIGRRGLDFRSSEFKYNFEGLKKFRDLIDEADVVINSAGVLGKPRDSYDTVFDVNFNSNWVILQHFMDKPPKSKKKFVIIGSTSYNHGREDYMLYAASKAAVFSLFQGAVKYFEGSNLVLGLVNPRSVKTKMTAHLKGDFMSAKACARRIFDFTLGLTKSRFIDLK